MIYECERSFCGNWLMCLFSCFFTVPFALVQMTIFFVHASNIFGRREIMYFLIRFIRHEKMELEGIQFILLLWSYVYSRGNLIVFTFTDVYDVKQKKELISVDRHGDKKWLRV